MTDVQIHNLSVKYRGAILHIITGLEKGIDVYLSRYFTSTEEKQDELMELVFGGLRITFENKRGILVYLSQKKKIKIEDDYPNMLSDMQDIFSVRKVMAHYMVDVSEEAQHLPDGTLRFISLNNKLDFKDFSKEKIRETIDQMLKMITVFGKEI